MTLKKTLFALVAVASIFSGNVTAPAASASEPAPAGDMIASGHSSAAQAVAKFSPIDNGKALSIDLSEGALFRSTSDGSIKVVDDAGNVVDTLPATATDAEGSQINFVYDLVDSDSLTVDHTSADGYVNYGWWSDWGKCTSGVIGGIGAGALAGAAAGNVIPVLGLPGGGIVGGISGGLTGAAAAC